VLGSIFPSVFDNGVADSVWQQLRLDSNSSQSFAAFEREALSPEHDVVLLRFFMFHVTNPHAVVGHGAKPVVEERGPFVYELEIDHLNTSIDADGPVQELSFITWQKVKLLTTGPDAGLKDDELITTANIPFQILLANAGDLDWFAVNALYFNQLKDPSQLLFTTRSVREHLFGYDNAFATPKEGWFAKHLLQGLRYPGFVQNFSTPASLFKAVTFDSLRVDRPASHVYASWQGSSQLKICKTCSEPLWNSRKANRVGGSDGKFFTTLDKPQVWLPELVRRADLEDRRDLPVSYRGTKVFGLSRNTFANSSTFPSNVDYFANYQPNGLLYMGRLLMNVPVYASKPHFLQGDEDLLLRSVEGVSPADPAIHETIFEVHVETGVSILVAERFQYNVLLKPDANFPQLSNVPRLYLPMFWFETLERLSTKHKHLFDRCDSLTRASRVSAILFAVLGVCSLVGATAIATLNAESDAKAKQRHSLLLERLELGDSYRDDDENEEVDGPTLLWSTPSLSRAWVSSVFVAFCMNAIIGTISFRGRHTIGIRATAIWQIPLTSFLVTFFSVAGGVAVARAAFARGEFPRRRARWEVCLCCAPSRFQFCLCLDLTKQRTCNTPTHMSQRTGHGQANAEMLMVEILVMAFEEIG